MGLKDISSGKVTLVFPNQLFSDHPAVSEGVPVLLIEHPLFFTRYKFHKHKLILHRASMKAWMEEKENQGYEVTYVEFSECWSTFSLFKELSESGVKSIRYCDPVDYQLEKEIIEAGDRYGILEKPESSPNFLTTIREFKNWYEESGKLYMADFYRWQRKRLGILVDDEGNPAGGKWSFDTDNRKKAPPDLEFPGLPRRNGLKYIDEAIEYVQKHFADNPGSEKDFLYPVLRNDALDWLDDFCRTRLDKYGDYQDAILSNQHFMYHSLLTPMMNIGLLNPGEVVQAVLDRHSKDEVALNNLEGFIRQVIGWREFMRGVYVTEGVFERTHNFFGHDRPVPGSFWNGKTGVQPVDEVIRKTLKTAYAHHIERLMVLGNFMLLCEFDPDSVYHWFMCLFIDAYDWVMVPNVYGMSQYADGGLITTKPYVSGSNYIRKMSDYGKAEWNKTWDGLYWRFIDKHKAKFRDNPRMTMMISLCEKMDTDKLDEHKKAAESFLKSLMIRDGKQD